MRKCLFKPVIIRDTRDKKGKHDNVDGYLAEQGYDIVRSKLYVGDVSLLNDQSTCIDLKQGLGEVEGNLIQQHDRFRAECLRAQEHGIRLVVLVEEDSISGLSDVAVWQNPRRAKWESVDRAHSRGKLLHVQQSGRPPVTGAILAKAMKTMAEKYGVEWQFCSKADTGRAVEHILMRHGL